MTNQPPPPRPIAEDLTAATLLLREDGRWRLETSVRETCGNRTEMEHEDEDGRYRAEGTTLHFLDDDGNRNHADWGLGGEIDPDELDQGTMADGGTLTRRRCSASGARAHENGARYLPGTEGPWIMPSRARDGASAS